MHKPSTRNEAVKALMAGHDVLWRGQLITPPEPPTWAKCSQEIARHRIDRPGKVRRSITLTPEEWEAVSRHQTLHNYNSTSEALAALVREFKCT